ncbi:hypothetical protein CR513_46682, partial [Mucuna pruriens]
MMVELCEQFKIQHHNSTPYRPKMNGVIEVANKNIKKIVQKMVLYQKRIKNAFDKKARPHVFREGDLVLKKVLPNSRDWGGKWAPNYKGALILTDDDG